MYPHKGCPSPAHNNILHQKPFSWFYRITRAWRKMVYYIQQLLRGQTHSSHACKQFAVSDWFKEEVSPASVWF
jgi:hypothetical protein